MDPPSFAIKVATFCRHCKPTITHQLFLPKNLLICRSSDNKKQKQMRSHVFPYVPATLEISNSKLSPAPSCWPQFGCRFRPPDNQKSPKRRPRDSRTPPKAPKIFVTSIKIPMPTPKSNLSILCCKILVQQVLQLRLDKRIAMEGWQKYSKGGLPRRLPGKPPLEYFRQSSIAMLRSILNCNTCWTRVLQQRIDKSIATLLWPLLTSLHIYPHSCFTVHVVHSICNLPTITASTLQRV